MGKSLIKSLTVLLCLLFCTLITLTTITNGSFIRASGDEGEQTLSLIYVDSVTHETIELPHNPSSISSTDDKVVLTEEDLVEPYGYKFKVWGYSAINFLKQTEGKYYIDYTDVLQLAEIAEGGERIIYVYWEPIAYDIILRYNVAAIVNPSSFILNPTYTIEDSIDLTSAEWLPSKYGYKFLGWYSDSLFTNPITSITNHTGELSLFGKFEMMYVTVQFANDEYPTETIPYGTSSKTYLADKKPVMEGYIFDDWYLDSDFTKKVPNNLEADSKTPIVLYAKFDKDYTTFWWILFACLISATLISFVIWYFVVRPRIVLS